MDDRGNTSMGDITFAFMLRSWEIWQKAFCIARQWHLHLDA